jgi:hypothetical protein
MQELSSETISRDGKAHDKLSVKQADSNVTIQRGFSFSNTQNQGVEQDAVGLLLSIPVLSRILFDRQTTSNCALFALSIDWLRFPDGRMWKAQT